MPPFLGPQTETSVCIEATSVREDLLVKASWHRYLAATGVVWQ
jgi:hypothetical protein